MRVRGRKWADPVALGISRTLTSRSALSPNGRFLTGSGLTKGPS